MSTTTVFTSNSIMILNISIAIVSIGAVTVTPLSLHCLNIHLNPDHHLRVSRLNYHTALY